MNSLNETKQCSIQFTVKSILQLVEASCFILAEPEIRLLKKWVFINGNNCEEWLCSGLRLLCMSSASLTTTMCVIMGAWEKYDTVPTLGLQSLLDNQQLWHNQQNRIHWGENKIQEEIKRSRLALITKSSIKNIIKVSFWDAPALFFFR